MYLPPLKHHEFHPMPCILRFLLMKTINNQWQFSHTSNFWSLARINIKLVLDFSIQDEKRVDSFKMIFYGHQFKLNISTHNAHITLGTQNGKPLNDNKMKAKE